MNPFEELLQQYLGRRLNFFLIPSPRVVALCVFAIIVFCCMHKKSLLRVEWLVVMGMRHSDTLCLHDGAVMLES